MVRGGRSPYPPPTLGRTGRALRAAASTAAIIARSARCTEHSSDHPGTRHDGYRLPPERRGQRFGYAPYSYSPSVTLGFGSRYGW